MDAELSRRPLEVGLDLTGMSALSSGVRTRGEDMIRALSQQRDELHLHLLTEAPWAVELGVELGLCVSTGPSGRARRLFGSRRRVKRFARQHHLDLVQLEAPPVPHGARVPLVFSLHDVRYLDYPLSEERTLFGLYQRVGLSRWARRAQLVLALTDTMADRYVAELRVPRDNVVTIPPGRPAVRSSSPPTVEHGRRYVLCLGHLEERKNLGVVVAATGDPRWPRDVELVLAGRDMGEEDRLRALAEQQPLCRCRFLGPVSDQVRDALLDGALAVALPSIVEGFGLVALEANAAGVPVIAANVSTSALPEVVGTSTTLLDADDPGAWAAVVDRLARDLDWRRDVTEEQAAWMTRFSWDDSAQRLVSSYRSVVEERSP